MAHVKVIQSSRRLKMSSTPEVANPENWNQNKWEVMSPGSKCASAMAIAMAMRKSPNLRLSLMEKISHQVLVRVKHLLLVIPLRARIVIV